MSTRIQRVSPPDQVVGNPAQSIAAEGWARQLSGEGELCSDLYVSCFKLRNAPAQLEGSKAYVADGTAAAAVT